MFLSTRAGYTVSTLGPIKNILQFFNLICEEEISDIYMDCFFPMCFPPSFSNSTLLLIYWYISLSFILYLWASMNNLWQNNDVMVSPTPNNSASVLILLLSFFSLLNAYIKPFPSFMSAPVWNIRYWWTENSASTYCVMQFKLLQLEYDFMSLVPIRYLIKQINSFQSLSFGSLFPLHITGIVICISGLAYFRKKYLL